MVSRSVFYTVLCLAFGLCVRAPEMAQALTYAQQLVLLEQANQAFEHALTSPEPQTARGYYHQALAGYAQLVAAGVKNARLYYNLGNTSFYLNDLGHAILYYRRGVRLEPGNRQLQANLRYARSQRVDQIQASNQRTVFSQLFFWHHALSLRTQWSLALAAYLLVWSGAGAHLFWRRATLLWGWAGAAFVCLLLTSSALLTHYQHSARPAGVIMAEEVVVRKGNGESYAPQFPQPLHAGTEFEVLEARGPWLAIQLDNGTGGWIRRESASLF